MEFEDVLFQVGDFGKYQRNLMLLFLFPSAALLPLFSMNTFFLVSTPDHWCYVPELDSLNLTLDEQKNLTRPLSDPQCSTYDVNYTAILSTGNWSIPANASTRPCTHGWSYDKTYYDYTAATQWNMVCENRHFSSLVLTLGNVGSIIATPIYGALSDRYGRKPTFFLTVLVTSVSAFASILMTNFTAFMVLRTINGSLMPSIFQLPCIILIEIVGPSMRTRINSIGNLSWTFGLCLLPLIAYLSREWITLGLVTSSFCVLFFLYWLILPESPRWLLSQDKYVEAAKIMAKIAETNDKSLEPAEIHVQLKKLGERIKKERKEGEEDASAKNLFKYPQLRKKFLIISFCWFANIMAYYGLMFNVTHLGGSEFVNFFLLAIFELPGLLCGWLFMNTLGRRWCSVSALTLTGLACLVPVISPETSVVASLVGKFGSSAAFMAVYQQSSELYPTTVRALGMGLSGTTAGVAAIAVPYVVYLAVFGKFIPFLIISVICLLAGFFVSFLPETLNENLPQTVSDSESFGLDQKYFACYRRRQPPCYGQRSAPLLNGPNSEATKE